MTSDTDKHAGYSARLPFTRPVARKISEELFHEQKQWKSSALVDRVVQLHRQRGGSTASDPIHMMRRVLKDLKDDGLVNSPGHGWLLWTESSPTAFSTAEEQVTSTITPVDEVIDVFEPSIRPDKEIGAGTECVYLYFNPNDRRLAELEGRDV